MGIHEDFLKKCEALIQELDSAAGELESRYLDCIALGRQQEPDCVLLSRQIDGVKRCIRRWQTIHAVAMTAALQGLKVDVEAAAARAEDDLRSLKASREWAGNAVKFLGMIDEMIGMAAKIVI